MKRMIDENDQKTLAEIWTMLEERESAMVLTQAERAMLQWLRDYGRRLVEREERRERWKAEHGYTD